MALTIPGPMLTGIKVIDLTSVVFGPYATQTLTDLGAEVIKVEAPAGDIFRLSGKPAKTRGMSAGHMTLNRGKQSVVLDLKQNDDLAVMKALIAGADVFIHNVRGDAIERLGLGYEAVHALKPDIVYVHCVGFGSGGLYEDLQAYDDVIQAATGTTHLLPMVDGNPRPRFLPSLIADKVAGLHGAYATMAAIIHRLRTGEGQKVEVPMFESFTHFMMKEHLYGQTFEPPTGPVGYTRQVDPDRQPFPCSDGWVSIVPYTDASWFRVFEALGKPDFLNAPEFATPLLRFQNLSLLYRGIAALTPSFTVEACLATLHAHDIPAMAARPLGEVIHDPHLEAVGFFRMREHPTEGAYREMKPPVGFSAWDAPPPSHPPLLGEHTEAVKAAMKGKG